MQLEQQGRLAPEAVDQKDQVGETMNLRDITAEKILDGFLVVMLAFFALLSLKYVGGSIEFSKSCESACGNVRSITPMMGGQEQCFCDEGRGRWRREEISVTR